MTGGNQAFYRPSTDTVHLPLFAAFADAESAYSVRAHECAHATAHPARLARDLSGRFGSEAYAMEEMIAQLTAAYVLADLAIANEPRPDDAAYIASWLEALKNDTRAVFTAAGAAQHAADWLHAQQPVPLTAEDYDLADLEEHEGAGRAGASAARATKARPARPSLFPARSRRLRSAE